MKKYFKRSALLTLSISVIASIIISTFSLGLIPALADDTATGWSNWGTADISGNETDGYNITSDSAFFAISNSIYDTKTQGLSFKISNIGSRVDWMWFSVSKEDVSNKELYPTGNGADVSRVSFFIRKTGDNKAKITYCCANGSTVEGPNVIIDFDWSAAHTYSVKKTDSGDWYLFVDSDIAKISSASTHLNQFMNANADSGLHFGLGSPVDGVHFTQIKAVDIPVDDAGASGNTWSYVLPHSSNQTGTLSGDGENGYSFSHTGRTLVLSNSKYDVSKYDVSLKLNSPVDNASTNGFFWFSLSRTHIEDNNILPPINNGSIDRISFIIWPEYSGDTTKTRLSIWNNEANVENSIVNIAKLDWTAEHSFGVIKDSDNNWYLTVDGEKVPVALSNWVSTYLDTYGEELYFGVGGQMKFDGEKIKLIERSTVNSDSGWSYVLPHSSNQTGTLSGDGENGYSFSHTGRTLALSNSKYDVSKYDVSLKLNSPVDNASTNGFFWFSLSRTHIEDNNILPPINNGSIDRISFIIWPEYSGDTTKTRLSIWNNEANVENSIVNIAKLDWTAEHSFGVIKDSDNNWYLTVDGEKAPVALANWVGTYLDTYGEELYFGVGGQMKFDGEKIKVIESKYAGGGDDITEKTGWSYWANDSSIGKLEGNDTDGYNVNSNIGLFAISNSTYVIPEKAVSLKLNSSNSTGGDGWFWFSITKSGTEDRNTTQWGEVENINRMVFIVHTNYNSTGQTRFSYWNTDSVATEKPIWTNNLDWSVPHTLSVTKNQDGHWYLTLDSMQLTGAMSANLDKFMELYSDTDSLRFGIGGQIKFSAEDINVIELGEVDEPEGWKYRSSRGNGEFSGDAKEGFSEYLAEGQLFAYTKKTYDVSKTAVEFKVDEVRDWIYFGISVTDREDTSPFPSGQSASEINRFIFIITPTSGGNAARCSFWNPADYSEEQIKTLDDFNWYTNHTLEVRQSEEGNWYLCIDGMMLMNKISTILNDFIKAHNEKGELRYALGGSGCFGASGIKIIKKPALKTNIDSSSGTVAGVTDIGEIDFGFDYGTEEEDTDNDYNFNDSFSNDYSDITFDSLESEEIESNESDVPEMIQVRYKKRKLVQKGHGIIFNTWEIIGMAVGAVAVLAGGVFLVIFLVKRKKQKKAKV